MAPDHHHTIQTLDNLLSTSTTDALTTLLDYNPYGPTATMTLPTPTKHHCSRPLSPHNRLGRRTHNNCHHHPLPPALSFASNMTSLHLSSFPSPKNYWHSIPPPSSSISTHSTSTDITTSSTLQSLNSNLSTLQTEVDSLTSRMETQITIAHPTPPITIATITTLIGSNLDHFFPSLSLPAIMESVMATFKASLQDDVLPQLSTLISSEISSTFQSPAFNSAICENIRQQLVLHFTPPDPTHDESSHPMPMITGGGGTTRQISRLGNSAPLGEQTAPTHNQDPHTPFILQLFPPSSTNFSHLKTEVQPHISWGDPLIDPLSLHMRVVFQNCNSFNKDHFERFTYLKQLASLQSTIIRLSETNINWSNSSIHQSMISDSLKARWPH